MRTSYIVAALALALLAWAGLEVRHELAPEPAQASTPDETRTAPAPSKPAPPPPAPAAAPAPAPAQPPSGARIHFDTTAIDFGQVPHGTVVVRKFAFRNTGTEALEILSAKASCGCTAALPSKRRFAPGESGEIEVRFDTGRKHLRGLSQRFANSVIVRTNGTVDGPAPSPATGMVRLVLQGEVVSHFAIVPSSGFLLRTALPGQGPAQASVRVIPKNQSEAALAGLQVRSVPETVTVGAPRVVTSAGKKGVEFTVQLRPDAPVGPIRDYLVLATADPEHPELRIPVRGYVPPPVRAQPTRLVLTEHNANRDVTLQLVSSDATPLRWLRTEVLPDEGDRAPIVVSAPTAEQGGRRLIFRVRLDPDAAFVHGATGRLRILLDHERQPAIVVPYRLYDTSFTRRSYQAQQDLGLRVSPPQLSLGEVAPGTTRQAIVTITDLKGGRLAVRDIEAQPAGVLEAQLEPSGAASRVVRLRVRLRPEHSGLVRGFVRFKPLRGEDRTIELPVQARVASRLRVEPAAARFAGDSERSTLVVTATGQRTFRATALEARPAQHFSASARPRPEGGLLIEVHRRPDTPPGTIAEIELQTDLEGEGPVSIPVFVTAPATSTATAQPGDR